MSNKRCNLRFSLTHLLVMFFLVALSSAKLNSQAIVSFENYYFWTGLQPDTIAGGPLTWVINQGPIYPNNTDGILGSPVTSPQLIGRRSCSDTLYRIYSSVDVTNNPGVSWDGSTSTTRSDGYGNLNIVWDNGFVEGEDNKVTIIFDFEQVPFGQPAEPITGGLTFPIDNYSAGNPPETSNFRVYNGATLVSEVNGITNSFLCPPLPADGTTNSAKHIFEIPIGQPYTRLEVDLYICAPNNGAVRLEFEEPSIPGAVCDPAPLDCEPGYGYYYANLDAVSNNFVTSQELTGWMNTGISFDVENRKIDADTNLVDPSVSEEALLWNVLSTNGGILTNLTGIDPYNIQQESLPNATVYQADTMETVYTFCAPVTSPILYIDWMITNTAIEVYDCNDNPIDVRWITADEDNIEKVTGYADGNLIRLTPGANMQTNTTAQLTKDDSPVVTQIVGNHDCIKLKYYNDFNSNYRLGSTGTAANTKVTFRMTLLHCGPLPVDGTCNYDLYQWKSDTTAFQYVLGDDSGNYFELLDGDFDNASIGDLMFVGAPVCGELVKLGNDVLANECPDSFVCPGGGGGDDVAVKIETVTPNGTGYFLDRHWQDTNVGDNDTTAIGGNMNRDIFLDHNPPSQWHDSIGPFAGPLDALGLPSYGAMGVASTLPPFEDNGMYGTIGTFYNDVTFGDINSYQHDGWLAIPPGWESVELYGDRLHNGTHALYVVESDGNVVEVYDDSWGDNRNDDTYGIYCINNPHTTFGAGWQLIRIRVYSHAIGVVRNQLHWKIPAALVRNQLQYHQDFEIIPSNFLWPADSPTSVTVPPVLLEDTLSVQYAIKDAADVYWEPNGAMMPTDKFDLPVDLLVIRHETVITECTDQPAPFGQSPVGPTCADVIAADFCQEITTCEDAIANNVDICALLDANPSSPLATEDCDEGGQSNADECAAGNDPNDPIDDAVEACDPSTPAPTITNGNN